MTETKIENPRQQRISMPPVASRGDAPSVRKRSESIMLPIFIVSLIIPIRFYVGSLLLSPYRVILVATFIPCTLAWVSGRAGRILSSDIFMLLTALWGALAIAVNNGADVAIQTGGIFLLETFGAYLLARCLIRDRASFESMTQLLFFIVVFLLPFALIENITGRAFLQELFGKVFTVITVDSMEPRWGLQRAHVTFEHPILFGVACSAVFGLTTFVMGKWSRSALVGLAVASSLSSGAFLSLMAQVGLIVWNRLTGGVRHRWGILGILWATGVFVVMALSHRTPVEVFVSYFTFTSSYWRIYIWQYGSQEVLRHPIFGIGLNDWIRPWWMHSPSVDNFWLLTAMQYGLPTLCLLLFAIFTIFVKLARKNLGDNVKLCRTGLLISLTGVMLALCATDLWKASYCLFTFLLGSGSWMLEETTPKFAGSATRIRKPIRYVRHRQSPPSRALLSPAS